MESQKDIVETIDELRSHAVSPQMSLKRRLLTTLNFATSETGIVLLLLAHRRLVGFLIRRYAGNGPAIYE